MTQLAIALALFVGTHFLMSHPLRRGLVSRMGEGPFRGLYSLVSFATLGWAVWEYRGLGRQLPLWTVPDAGWIVANIVMWAASVLLVGSFFGNPALPNARVKGGPSGTMRITRHPMMWSFALWALVHAALIATPKALLLDFALLFLALAGAAGQDAKKKRAMGKRWGEWVAQTSFVPFGRGFASPGAVALIGGSLVYTLATWLHPLPIGLWRLG